jgi:hypothetical protein
MKLVGYDDIDAKSGSAAYMRIYRVMLRLELLVDQPRPPARAAPPVVPLLYLPFFTVMMIIQDLHVVLTLFL